MSDEGYVGFMLGIDQMKKTLAEKDREIERLKAEVTRYRRALHNLKEDCQKRLHWKYSSLEGLFLHEVITHIDAELDYAPDSTKGVEK